MSGYTLHPNPYEDLHLLHASSTQKRGLPAGIQHACKRRPGTSASSEPANVKDTEGRECRARYSQNWLLRVKSSALVTGFVLAEGTHQTRCLFGEF